MNNKTTPFNIFKIKELSYNFNKFDTADIQEFDAEKLYIGYGLGFSPSETKEVFVVNLKVIYEYKKNDLTKTEILSMESDFYFHIGELENLLIEHNLDFELPKSIMESIVGISVSTMRGMIAVKTAGNFINDYPLPVIDVNTLINDLLVKSV